MTRLAVAITDRSNRAPLKGVTLTARRCGACNRIGHTSRSKACPYHPGTRCLDCNEQRQHHGGRDHRFRAEPTIGEIVDAAKVKP